MKSKQEEPPIVRRRRRRPTTDAYSVAAALGLVIYDESDVGAEYLDRVLGDKESLLALSIGRGGTFGKNGKSRYTIRLINTSLKWPASPEQVAEKVADWADDDIFVTPNPRLTEHRTITHRKECAFVARYLWVDIDDAVGADQDLLCSLLVRGGFVVVSSSRGLHAYIKLDRWYEGPEVERANKRLRDVLGADHKWAGNTLLRLPGTLNHKGRARGGESEPVQLFLPPREASGWDLAELVAYFDEISPPTESRTTARRAGAPAGPNRRRRSSESRDLDVPALSEELRKRLPGYVLHIVDEDESAGTKSRSERTNLLVRLLFEAGFTAGEVLRAMESHRPSAGRREDGKDVDRDVERLIEHFEQHHDHPGSTCIEADCDNVSAGALHAAEVATLRSGLAREPIDGRSGKNYRRVQVAHLDVAEIAGSFNYSLSTRELAERSGMTRTTATKHQSRLISQGLVERDEPDADPTMAQSFRLVAERWPHSTATGNEVYGPTSALERHDAFRPAPGLGNSALATYRFLLENGGTSPEKIAGAVGVSVRWLNERILPRLIAVGLVEKRGRSRGAVPVPVERLDEIAKDLGTDGTGAKQKAEHERQRGQWRGFVAQRPDKASSMRASGWRERTEPPSPERAKEMRHRAPEGATEEEEPVVYRKRGRAR